MSSNFLISAHHHVPPAFSKAFLLQTVGWFIIVVNMGHLVVKKTEHFNLPQCCSELRNVLTITTIPANTMKSCITAMLVLESHADLSITLGYLVANQY